MGYAMSNFEYVPALARRVLVVQPDGPQHEAVLRALTLWGFEASAAEGVSGATEQLIRQPDFILVDHQLPDGTCVDLLRRVRRRNHPAVVAVMLGAEDRWFPDLPALRPDAVFRKPVNVTWLRAWLENHKPEVVRWSAIDARIGQTFAAASPKIERN